MSEPSLKKNTDTNPIPPCLSGITPGKETKDSNFKTLIINDASTLKPKLKDYWSRYKASEFTVYK